MRPSNIPLINSIPSISNIASSVIWIDFGYRISFQAVTTGSDTSGSLQVQVSNDFPGGTPGNTFIPTNWSNIGSSVTVSSGNNIYLIPEIELSYEYVRIIYTDASSGMGNGLISVRAKLLGV